MGERTAWQNHANGECAGAALTGGSGLALSTPARHRACAGPPTTGAARTRDCNRRQGATTTLQKIPEADGRAQTSTEGRRRDRTGIGGISMGGAANPACGGKVDHAATGQQLRRKIGEPGKPGTGKFRKTGAGSAVETGAARGNPVKDACGDFLFDGFPPPAWKSRKNAGFSTVPTAPADQ